MPSQANDPDELIYQFISSLVKALKRPNQQGSVFLHMAGKQLAFLANCQDDAWR
jgi:hypothetical protein